MVNDINKIFKIPIKKEVQYLDGRKSIIEDFAIRKVLNTQEGTIEKVPVDDKDIANKKYVDDNAGGAPEGTAVKSTGEGGGTKYLREDGDGTCSWQTPAGSGDVTAAINLTANTIVQGDDGAKGVKTSTATVAQIASNVTHVAGDGSDHADVASNTTHRSSNGTNHANVVLNDTHRGSDGSDHADVVSNTTHRNNNSQAHADYLKNNASDITSGTITAGGFTTTGVSLTGDHGTATTDQVVNVCYGTSATPPTASTTTEGALYIQYTA